MVLNGVAVELLRGKSLSEARVQRKVRFCPRSNFNNDDGTSRELRKSGKRFEEILTREREVR